MKLDKNIELHCNKLRITFYWGKVKCTESTGLDNTPENLKKVKLIRDSIQIAIKLNKFVYEEYFPNSPRANLFKVQPKSYLMRDLFEQQIQYIESNKKYSKYTKRDYTGYISKYLIPTFGKIRITELTALDIKNWILSSPQSPDFIGNVIIQLRATLADAMNDGMISDNPLKKLDIKRLFQQLNDESNYEIDPFNSRERRLILDSTAGEFKNIIQFGLFSGMRIGEILALRWENVNLNTRKIKVKFTMNDGELERPKTPDSDRELLLLDKAFEALSEQFKFKSDDGFVFHNPNTGTYWRETDAFRKHWVRLFNVLDIKYRNPYQMRHTFASMLISKGENIHKVAKYLGHKNIKMVIGIYGKFIPEDTNNGLFVNNYDD